jgi:hypothetical protein
MIHIKVRQEGEKIKDIDLRFETFQMHLLASFFTCTPHSTNVDENSAVCWRFSEKRGKEVEEDLLFEEFSVLYLLRVL